MKYTVHSHTYGKIEIDDEKKVAYFFRDDMEYPIKGEYFHDIYERSFHIVWPILPRYPELVLEVMWMKEVGRAKGEG